MSTSPQSDTGNMKMVTLPIDEIVPYWRNPRKITSAAVNAVAESIKKYGYRQPIVVDGENVIIIGHTRYMALRRLGVTEVPVRVETGLSQRQVKELRTVDNRAAEYTEWDFDKLTSELERLGPEAGMFFEDVLGSTSELTDESEVWQDEEEDSEPKAAPDLVRNDVAEFICPGCFHSWEQVVTLRDIQSGKIKEKA